MRRTRQRLLLSMVFLLLPFGCHTHRAPTQVELLLRTMAFSDKQPLWHNSSAPAARPDGRYEIELLDNHCYWFAASTPVIGAPVPLRIEDAGGTDIGKSDACVSESKWVVKICRPGGGNVFLSTAPGSHKQNMPPVLRGWKKPMPTVKAIVGDGTCDSPALLTSGFSAPIKPIPLSPFPSSAKGEASGYYVFKLNTRAPSKFSGVIYGAPKGSWEISSRCQLENQHSVAHGFSEREDYHQFSTSVHETEAFLILQTHTPNNDMGLWAEWTPIPEKEHFCAEARSVIFEDRTNGSFHYNYASVDINDAPAYDLFKSRCDRMAAEEAQKYSDAFDPADRLFSFEVNERSRVYIESGAQLVSVRDLCGGNEITCSTEESLRYVARPGRYYMTFNGGAPSPVIHMSPTDQGNTALASFCEETSDLNFAPTLHTYYTYDEPNRLSGSCGGKFAPETIYTFVIEERAIFMAGTTQNGSLGYGYPEADWPMALYLLSQCDSTATEHICVNPSEKGNVDIHTILEPGTWYLVVDGKEESDFGEGILYANTMPTRPLERTCERARPLHLNGVEKGEIVPTQKQFFPLALNVFTMAWDAQMYGPESVYSLTLKQRKKVTFKLTADFDAHLFVRSDCADIHSEQGYAHAPDGQTELTVTLEPGAYYVFVDTGKASASRMTSKQFTLKTQTTPFK